MVFKETTRKTICVGHPFLGWFGPAKMMGFPFGFPLKPTGGSLEKDTPLQKLDFLSILFNHRSFSKHRSRFPWDSGKFLERFGSLEKMDMEVVGGFGSSLAHMVDAPATVGFLSWPFKATKKTGTFNKRQILVDLPDMTHFLAGVSKFAFKAGAKELPQVLQGHCSFGCFGVNHMFPKMADSFLVAI